MRRLGSLFALGLLLASCSDVQQPTTTLEPDGDPSTQRLLRTAADEDVFIEVFVDGAKLTSDDEGSLEIETRKMSQRTIHKLDKDNRTIEKNPNPLCEGCDSNLTVATCPGAGCSNAGFTYGVQEDQGNQGANFGLVWDGVYQVRLVSDLGTNCSWLTMPTNHIDDKTANGNFLDEIAHDYRIIFNLDASLNCTSESIVIDGTSQTPDAASSQLSVSISAPDSVGVNDNFTATASANGGFGSGYKFSFNFNAVGGNEESFSEDLGTGSDTHSYSQTGMKKVRAVARDGDDTDGGNYALSSVHTVTVVPERDADAAGHTLPDTIEVYDVVATSVSMTNTGGDTWSGSSYELKQASISQVWTPSTVGLGTSTVDLNETHTFNFNIRTLEPEELGFQDNFWKMSHSGTLFGEQNGQQTYVEEGSLGSGWLNWIENLAGWFSPSRALAHYLPTWIVDLQEEVVQELRIVDLPIPTRLLEDEGEFRLRYLASLDKPWDVDFRFRIVFDDSTLKIGRIVQGVRSAGYHIKIEKIRPGEVVIEGTRDATTGLNGSGKILEIPVVLKPNTDAPETLALVELIAFR